MPSIWLFFGVLHSKRSKQNSSERLILLTNKHLTYPFLIIFIGSITFEFTDHDYLTPTEYKLSNLLKFVRFSVDIPIYLRVVIY